MHSVLSVLVITTALTAQTQVSVKKISSIQRVTAHKLPTKQAVVRPAPAMHDIERRLIEQTNAMRAQYGLHPLATDMGLVHSARRHTAWMTNSRTLQHSTAMVAENIAMGQRSVAEAINSWMSSSGHRANMLSGSYRRLGVSAYRTPDGTIYWCQQFAW
jgi:uncharacterized protein YkwD